MCSVEVVRVSTRLTPSFCTPSHSHPCHSGARHFQEFESIPQLLWIYLVHLGFHFGCVVMRFLEVARVSTGLTLSFFLASYSHGCLSSARDFQELRVYSQTPLALSSAPGSSVP